MKTCKYCLKTKNLEEFRWNICKWCRREQNNIYMQTYSNKESSKKYMEANKDKKKEYDKNRYEKVKDKVKENIKSHRKEINERRRVRRKEDISFRLSERMRIRLWSALKSEKTLKWNKTMIYVWCTKEELKLHLEKQFTDWMSWENYWQWHIDHKIPFKYHIDNGWLTEENLFKVMHFSNLQPLWAEDNHRKGWNIYF